VTHPLDDFVIALGADLYRQWAPAHGIGRNDALLAASAMLGGGVVYTLNTRHYPMPGIDVVRPW
jgi:hypothetical protein